MSKNEENLVDKLKASIRSTEENENEKRNSTESDQSGYNKSNESEQNEENNKNKKITYTAILVSSLAEAVLIEVPKMLLISFLFMFIWNNALIETISQIPKIDYMTSIIIYALASLLQSSK